MVSDCGPFREATSSITDRSGSTVYLLFDHCVGHGDGVCQLGVTRHPRTSCEWGIICSGGNSDGGDDGKGALGSSPGVLRDVQIH